MALTTSEMWNLASSVVSLVVAAYAYRLFSTFKGGNLSRGNGYILLGILVGFATFLLSFMFSYEGVNPVVEFGISVKNVGMLIAFGFVGLGLREFSRFWNPSTPIRSSDQVPVHNPPPLTRRTDHPD